MALTLWEVPRNPHGRSRGLRWLRSEKAGMKHRITASLIVLFLAATAAAVSIAAAGLPEAYSKPVITFRQNTEVGAEYVILGQVATVAGVSDERKMQAESAKFCLAPPPGKSLTLNQRQIKGYLYNSGVDPDEFIVNTPAEIVITRGARIVTGREIIDGSTAYLRDRFAAIGISDLQIDSERTPQDIVLPTGDVKLIYDLDIKSDTVSVQSLKARVMLDGEQVRIISLSGYIRASMDVVTATRTLDPGITISEADVTTAKRDVSRVRPGTLRTVDDVIGKTVYRRLSQNDVITKSSLTNVPDITSGQLVKIVVKRPGIEIVSKGKAIEKGYIGEIIRVINTDTKKIINAVVTDSESVEIIMK